MYEVIKGVCVSLLPVVVNEMYHVCSFIFLWVQCSESPVWCYL